MGRAHRYCTAKPDADNLAKAILDGMTQGRAWGDDDQVVLLKVIKLWCAEGDEPRVDVDATEVGE
jgi:Holliday junction resolvase RusA-like endonuclease